MELAYLLSRAQFGFCLTFHYIYPPLSIGLSLALVIMELFYLKTGSKLWESLFLFWLRVFALTFALGAATGIPLQFMLGTNWGGYSRFVGDVFGSALAAEGFFAFLVEGGFLGLLLFGWKRVSKKIHFLSTVLVCLAAHFSAFWIIAANAWMQTPSGYRIITDEDGTRVAQVTDWFAMVFNPSSMTHISHAIFSCWLSGSLLMVSVGAYYLLKNRHLPFALKTLKVAGWTTLAAVVIHFTSAHALAVNTALNQPLKMAAHEGHFETMKGAPISLAGWVDVEKRQTYGIKIPYMLSLLIYNDPQAEVKGLNDFPKEEWPNVNLVFQMYHIMVGTIFFIIASAIGALMMVYRPKWREKPFLLKCLIASVVFPQIGNLTGWYATCFGRQPWIVKNELKTVEGLTPGLTSGEAITSFLILGFLYLAFFILFLFLLDKKIKHGPSDAKENLPYRNLF